MSARRLLVVDDEPGLTQVVRAIGEGKNFIVETLSDSRDFVATYRRFEPSVIVLDIVMPKIDGIEIVQWLVANDNTASVILVSGYNPDYAKAAEILASAGGRFPIKTLTKPVRRSVMEAALEAMS